MNYNLERKEYIIIRPFVKPRTDAMQRACVCTSSARRRPFQFLVHDLVSEADDLRNWLRAAVRTCACVVGWVGPPPSEIGVGRSQRLQSHASTTVDLTLSRRVRHAIGVVELSCMTPHTIRTGVNS
jgi:hypothetical protein